MKPSFRIKIILITFGILFSIITANVAINYYNFSGEYSKALESKMFVVGQTLKFQMERLLLLGIPINELVGFEEQCKSVVDSYEEISYAMILDKDGTILFHNNPSQQKGNINDPGILAALKNTNGTTLLHYENGKGYYDILIPIFGKTGEYSGSVRIGFLTDVIREKTFSTIIYSVELIAVFFVLAFISLFFALSTWVTKPLDKLLSVIKEIGEKGNLEKRVEVKSKDEIGKLASAFNQMTEDLKQSQEQIKRHAEELEKKVEGRTKDLDQKVKELTSTKTAVLNMMEDMDETNKELIQTQEELKKSLNELKEMDIKKDQFISIAAHELKTPLTSIHGFSQLLQNRKVANDFTKRNKYLKIMDHETKRLAKLVTDILDLSRIDLGTVKLSFEEVNVNKFMEDIKREMDVHIKSKKLDSEYDIEKDLPKIKTDMEKLTEILINLINNAVKYTPKGKITIKVLKEKRNVHFSVKDTGIGISKENQEKVFERFYQVDSSFTRKAGGTGLGLALCKEFLSILGGEIWVKSEEGNGSEFHFTLPIKGAPKEYIREGERKAKEALKKSEETMEKLKKTRIGETRL